MARRAGINRVTLARWETGASSPQLADVIRLAAVVGKTIEVKIGAKPMSQTMIDRVNEQLDIGPTARLRRMAGSEWPSLRVGLGVAAWMVDEAAVIGSAAAAVRGVPAEITGRVDLLVRPEDVLRVIQIAEEFAGVVHAGSEVDSSGVSERQILHTELGGEVTLVTAAPGIEDVAAVINRAQIAVLNEEDIGHVRFALLEDLIDFAAASPWREEFDLSGGLAAVLASGRYSVRVPLTDQPVNS